MVEITKTLRIDISKTKQIEVWLFDDGSIDVDLWTFGKRTERKKLIGESKGKFIFYNINEGVDYK